ncbi:MAG: nucleoside monophosphate kinase [Pseudomonadales bacterium]|nr:nucleoside monophosphate kinase [Candidatus Woesebacteria bacterium]MCB9801725.1 nucleoside monophosphate kinase [Pseudomonadales bacterium]
MKLVLIGIQGAGKSTQGNLLSERYNLPYLSSGHIFREMAKEKTKLGRWLKETLNAGALVPDDTTLEVVLTYLEKPEYEAGYILDGFPRTVPQAEAFNGGVDQVVYLAVSDREALWRISGRVSDREDETLSAIRKRIELFHEHTEPVTQYYKSQEKLCIVDGEETVEEVFAAITKQLDTIHTS